MTPIAAVLAIVLLLAGSYVAAYLGLGNRVDWKSPSGDIGTIERTYTQQWALTAFAPATWVETQLRRVQVQAVHVSLQNRR
jgi:hypothetical protein